MSIVNGIINKLLPSRLVNLIGLAWRQHAQAQKHAKLYAKICVKSNRSLDGLFCRYEPAYNYNSKIDYVNYMAYMGGHHHYMFDEENLEAI